VTSAASPARSSDARASSSVAGGILIARLLGFVRERVFAHYFGNGPAADAFRAALRIPNVLRNLLGEGTLSASFIPVYASLLEKGDEERAGAMAGTIASILVLLTAVAAIAGIALAPVITDIVAPGFSGETRALTVTLVQILFPMSGVMILSAWCLGVLNAHRRFFLSYAAPALWNIAQIATLLALGGVLAGARLVTALAFGALVGSILQVAVQLPATLRLAGRMRWSVTTTSAEVRDVIVRWAPVVLGAGAYQISSIVDTQLASLLEQGSVAIIGYAQLLAILPVSLFGVSVAAVALPELSRDVAADTVDRVRARLADATRRVAFFVIPAAAALAALAFEAVGALFRTGAFGDRQVAVAGAVLSAYAIAVPAQATVKLFASGHYALGDTKTPVRIALVSVVISATSAYMLMQRFGPVGIALGAAIASYVNMSLNYWFLRRRIGRILTALHVRALFIGVVAVVPAVWAAEFAAQRLAPSDWLGLLVGGSALGGIYLALTVLAGHSEARALLKRTWRS